MLVSLVSFLFDTILLKFLLLFSTMLVLSSTKIISLYPPPLYNTINVHWVYKDCKCVDIPFSDFIQLLIIAPLYSAVQLFLSGKKMNWKCRSKWSVLSFWVFVQISKGAKVLQGNFITLGGWMVMGGWGVGGWALMGGWGGGWALMGGWGGWLNTDGWLRGWLSTDGWLSGCVRAARVEASLAPLLWTQWISPSPIGLIRVNKP